MKKYLIVQIILFFNIFLNAQNKKITFAMDIHESFRTMKTMSNEENVTNIFQRRSSDEKPLKTISVSLTYEFLKHKNLSLKSGLGVTSYGYWIAHLIGARWPSEITLEGYKYDPTLPHDIIAGRSGNFLTIPISINYAINFSKHVSLVPSIMVQNQMFMYSKGYQKTDIGNFTNSYFQLSYNIRRFNLAYEYKLAINVDVYKSLSVQLGYSRNAQLFDTNIIGPIREKQYKEGIVIGANYSF